MDDEVMDQLKLVASVLVEAGEALRQCRWRPILAVLPVRMLSAVLDGAASMCACAYSWSKLKVRICESRLVIASEYNLLMEPAQIQPSSEEHKITIVLPNATYSIYYDRINRRPAINSGPPLGSTEVCTETGPYIPQELVFGRSPVSTAVDAHAVRDDEMTEEETLWAIPIQETVLHYQDELVLSKC